MRCKCFNSGTSCENCKCRDCCNPNGKKKPEGNKEERKRLTDREIASKSGHSGKLKRGFESCKYSQVKTDWNPFEKILLRRIFKSSVIKDIDPIFDIYIQYAKESKTNLIREKDFESVAKALKKLT